MKILVLLAVLAATPALADPASPAQRQQDPYDGMMPVVIHGTPPQGMLHQAPPELTGTPIRPGQKAAPEKPASEKPDRALGIG